MKSWTVWLEDFHCPYRVGSFLGMVKLTVARCSHRSHPKWNPWRYPPCTKEDCPIRLEHRKGYVETPLPPKESMPMPERQAKPIYLTEEQANAVYLMERKRWGEKLTPEEEKCIASWIAIDPKRGYAILDKAVDDEV